MVVWTEARADTSFEICSECPKLRLERMYILRENGYELYDDRLVPSPLATFTLFIRLLQQQNPTAARRLMSDPAHLDEALAAGWSKRGPGIWKMEYAEEHESWPRWLAFQFHGPHGAVRYIVHFERVDGRWLIRDWVTPHAASSGTMVKP